MNEAGGDAIGEAETTAMKAGFGADYTAAQAAGALKQADERWTTRLGLTAEMVSYESVISPEFFALEREAVFRRSWLYMGRVEELKTPGSYFTREVDVLSTSLIIVKGRDRTIRAFHNSCPHRGNKLVWEGDPTREVSGRCAVFVCKYHGLGFGTDGAVAKLTAPTNWMDGQGDRLRLAEVACEVINGFIFVNFEKGGPRKTLRDYLGAHFAACLEQYPFEKLTGHIAMTGTAKSNWKTLHDAFSEGYHATTLHKWSFPQNVSADPDIDTTPRATSYHLDDPHRSIFMGGFSPPPPYFDIEKFGKGNGTGPKIGAFTEELSRLPDIMNPINAEEWFHVGNAIFPNTIVQHYGPGWYLTYRFMPIAHDEMRFDIDLYFPEPRNYSEVLAHHTALSFIYDAFLQDLSTLEATQRGLAARAFDAYPLIDEEIQVRHLHKMIYDAVDAYKAENGLD